MQFKAQFPRLYMFFGARSSNLTPILKSDVELVVFLRIRNDKITKNGETFPFKAKCSRLYIFFGTQSSNLRSILKPEVDIDGVSAHAQ